MAPDPACAGFDVGALDSRPGYAVRPFLSICFIRMRSVSVIERLAINILSVLGQMGPDGLRQIDIRRIGHLASLSTSIPIFSFSIGRLRKQRTADKRRQRLLPEARQASARSPATHR